MLFFLTLQYFLQFLPISFFYLQFLSISHHFDPIFPFCSLFWSLFAFYQFLHKSLFSILSLFFHFPPILYFWFLLSPLFNCLTIFSHFELIFPISLHFFPFSSLPLFHKNSQRQDHRFPIMLLATSRCTKERMFQPQHTIIHPNGILWNLYNGRLQRCCPIRTNCIIVSSTNCHCKIICIFVNVRFNR